MKKITYKRIKKNMQRGLGIVAKSLVTGLFGIVLYQGCTNNTLPNESNINNYTEIEEQYNNDTYDISEIRLLNDNTTTDNITILDDIIVDGNENIPDKTSDNEVFPVEDIKISDETDIEDDFVMDDLKLEDVILDSNIMDNEEEVSLLCWNTGFNKTFGNQFDDYANSVKRTSDNGFIVSGFLSEPVSGVKMGYAWIMKLDNEGEIEWENILGTEGLPDEATSVTETNNGQFLATGIKYTPEDNSTVNKAWVIKFNNTGTVVWDRVYGERNFNVVFSILEAQDLGYIVGGSTSIGPNKDDAWIFKLDNEGEILWENIYINPGKDRIESVNRIMSNGYIISGYKNIITEESNNSQGLVLKLNLDGETEWETVLSLGEETNLYSVQQTEDLGYIAAGYIKFEDTEYFDTDLLVVKLNQTGNVEWYKTFGGDHRDKAYSIKQTLDLGYIIAGETNHNAWALRLDSNGNKIKEMIGEGEFGASYSVDITEQGGFVFAGERVKDAWVFTLDETEYE